MQIETLRVFCDLVERRSFSQAAAYNFVTQSAVSQQVKMLESYFDTPLLVRERRSIQPTHAGIMLYQVAREIIDRFERVRSQIESLGEEITGSVRLAAVYTVGLYELSAVVKSFLKTYPKVNLHVEYSRPNRVYEDCLSGAVDLGIVAYPRARKGLEVRPLPSDRLVLICPPDHPFARKRQIEIRKLDGQNFVAFEKDLPSRQEIDRTLQKHRIKVNVVMEFDNIETIKRSVEIGAGISIVPQLSAQREVQSGALAEVRLAGENLFRSIGVILRRNHAPSPATAKFIEILSQPPADHR